MSDWIVGAMAADPVQKIGVRFSESREQYEWRESTADVIDEYWRLVGEAADAAFADLMDQP